MLIKETYIFCDTKDCSFVFGIDNRHRTATEQRELAKKMGWKYKKGKDICPYCSKKKDEFTANYLKEGF